MRLVDATSHYPYDGSYAPVDATLDSNTGEIVLKGSRIGQTTL
jgi:hypothetical protein